jgi:exodeoxyribonuclease V alpha subunit
MELSTQQNECIEKALNPDNRIFAITGPAGTGKTTVLTELCKRVEASKQSYALAAPTGKAAKRIRQVTELNAVTCHKLLEYGKPGERDEKTGEALDTTMPKRDRMNPLACDVLLVDEYSMITHELNRNLVDALKSGARMIVVGDVAQLPPVEKYTHTDPMSPFRKYLENKDKSFTLTEVFRQEEGSDILESATRVRNGQMIRSTDTCKIKITSEPIRALEDFIFDNLDKGIDFSTIHNQIISPMKKRWVGTYELNKMLRNILNEERISDYMLPRHKWEEDLPVHIAIGDKVVCTENTYDMRPYNDT